MIIGESDLNDDLQQLAGAARETVPRCDNASITLILHGSATTPAATDRVVLELDLLQYDRGEGPCLDAIREGRVIRVDFIEAGSAMATWRPGLWSEECRASCGRPSRRAGAGRGG